MTPTVVGAALEAVSADRVAEWTERVVNIASPVGEEVALARFLVEAMASMGLEAELQPVETGPGITPTANAIGRLPSEAGSGPTLLLYAPMDTVTAGRPDEDTPWAATNLRPDMEPAAHRVRHDGDRTDGGEGWVVGLGAHNPKGHVATILAAVEAVARAEAVTRAEVMTGSGVGFGGRLVVGFGALGMPLNRRAPNLADGHGQGCAALIEAVRPDAAVIAKSGWAVSSTEVGLAWFTVTVDGTHTYVGSRHLLTYRSAIATAARIIIEVEDWAERWADERDDGVNRPQVVVASVDGGQARATAFTPATCSFTVDVRLTPATSPTEAETELRRVVETVAAGIDPEVTVTVEPTVTIPGTETDSAHPIITSAITAWEDVTGQTHHPIVGLSGATDANILRAAGVPTARIGLPKVSASGVDVDFQYGMNAVDPADQVLLARHLIQTTALYLGAGQ